MSEYFPKSKPLRENVKFKLDLSNYAVNLKKESVLIQHIFLKTLI